MLCMKALACLSLAVCIAGVTGDSSCRRLRGTCHYTWHKCNGRFLRGKCNGPSYRQCCVPTPGDASCRRLGGTCRYTWQRCNGRFQRGKCSGPSNRQCCVPVPVSTGKYDADIMRLSPTGCKTATCKQDGLRYSGVRGSNKMLDNDYGTLNRKKFCYVRAGNRNRIHPAVIAAIASRESRAGRVLRRHPKTRKFGWGDCKNGNCRAYGVMQCDVYSSGFRERCTRYGYDSCAHIEMMTRDMLKNTMLRCVKRKFPNWPPERQLQGAVAAYNFGCGHVRSWGRLDRGTTGHDYSNDVMARAQRLVRKYRW